MLWLTEETGQDVITSDGAVLGPVRDALAQEHTSERVLRALEPLAIASFG